MAILSAAARYVMLTSAAFCARWLKEADESEAIQHALNGSRLSRGLSDSGTEACFWKKLVGELLLVGASSL